MVLPEGVPAHRTINEIDDRLLFSAKHGTLTEQSLEASLADGANINAPDIAGYTPLHYAVMFGHVEPTKLLLKNGANVHAATHGGRTPLQKASEQGFVDTVSLLLAADADVNLGDEDGTAPLTWAAFNNHLDVVEVLLAAGADRTAIGLKDRTALDWAVERGHAEVMTVLTPKVVLPVEEEEEVVVVDVDVPPVLVTPTTAIGTTPFNALKFLCTPAVMSAFPEHWQGEEECVLTLFLLSFTVFMAILFLCTAKSTTGKKRIVVVTKNADKLQPLPQKKSKKQD